MAQTKSEKLLAQLGRLLKDTDRNKGGYASYFKSNNAGTTEVPALAPREDDTPTLADLGLDKKTSKLAQLGRLLKETQKATGGQPYHHNSTPTNEEGVENKITTYAELGLNYKTAKLAQDIAELPEEQFV